jgi:acyl-coenzyme A synthetase/AMP-(fatty) acid ligase
MTMLSLLPGYDSSKTLAWRNGRSVSQAEFLADALALASRLPETGHVFNLCKDRYWFSVALFAAISRDIVSLLQNSTAPKNMAALYADFPDAICVGEQDTAMPEHMPYVAVSQAGRPDFTVPLVVPQIPHSQVIARIFTSGSTGTPQAHTMRFGRMVHCAIAEAQRMWETVGQPCAVLGTVPPQHMFGLEATVLLPIFGGGQLSAGQPFFAADVASALAELPEPRLLVTTPFHLRKLMDANIKLPRVSAVLSATAPLSLELAQEVEAQLQAPMVEIYGSTETGALATRRPTRGTDWQTYAGITLQTDDQQTRACAEHFDAPQLLNDVVELIGASQFRLLGRNSDMINIVGKRSSLAFLNQLLQSLPDVEDGVFCMHESTSQQESGSPRLLALVVAPKLQHKSADILTALRQHVDPVFLPRPVLFVDALPRDANGKLSAVALAELIARHLNARH